MTENPPQPRRRWSSLSVGGLMLLILVVGGLMGWQARKASLQRRAVAAIERAGGSITYDYESPTGDPQPPGPVKDPGAPKWLRRMLGDEYFREITGVFRDGAMDPSLGGTRFPTAPGTEPSPEERAKIEALMASLVPLGRLQTLQLMSTRLSPAAVADLGRLTGLTTLTLDDTIDANEQLVALRDLTRLEHLTIQLDAGNGPGVPSLGDGLEGLASLVNLRELVLGGDSVHPRSLDFIDGMANLEILDVEHSPWNDTFLAKLAAKSRLKTVDLPETVVTDAGMAGFARLPDLESLRVDGQRVTDAGLAHLAGSKKLEALGLGLRSPAITDAGLAHLAGLTRFKTLQIWGGRVTDAGLAHLAGMTAMEDLRLARMPITDAGLVHLAKMASLNHLDLSETRVTGAGLAHLPSPAMLWYLMLVGAPVTDDGLAPLSAMTGLSILYLARTRMTDAGLKHLTSLKSLQILDLDQTAVTPEGLAALRPGWVPPVRASHLP